MKECERRGSKLIGVMIVGVIVLMTSVAAHAFESKLEPTSDGKAVFDEKSGLYWFTDLRHFNNMSYEEQLQAIAKLPGKWRMATLEDIRTLDVHPDPQIHAVFRPLSISKLGKQSVAVYNGRINCSALGEGLHSMAYMSHDMGKNCTHSPLKYKGLSVTDGRFKGLGAWVVSDGPYMETAQKRIK
jgi:hypothetical protein